jgi:hypothetical protein
VGRFCGAGIERYLLKSANGTDNGQELGDLRQALQPEEQIKLIRSTNQSIDSGFIRRTTQGLRSSSYAPMPGPDVPPKVQVVDASGVVLALAFNTSQ